MEWQSIGRITFAISAAGLLSGCLTFENAQPEKYAAYDCEQLAMLSESYRASPQDMLLEEDPSELERTNSRRNFSTLYAQNGSNRPIDARAERDSRSIALARRQKGCL